MDTNNTNTMSLAMLEPEMAELLAEFLEKIKDKGIKEMMPVLAEFKKRLPKDRTFSDEEKSAIIEGALASMPDDEKNRYKAFLKMVNFV